MCVLNDVYISGRPRPTATKARPIFEWFNILYFNIFRVVRKMNIFGGFEDFVDIFWGHHIIGLVYGSFLCILHNLDILGVAYMPNLPRR